ncbi:MAG: aminotransferase class I/II-fold pyridoxal phosphate-dependent enzyme [Alphaproteobacteria bacterium]|nr:MAG: aminotransferase class I/II-fold pyridoxal phosphate-dependent enzyme [Alphaproteobacteria bacterium]
MSQPDQTRQVRLDQLGAYPFERLKVLLHGIAPNPDLEPIDAGAGEPRLPLPDFVAPSLNEALDGFSRYPATRGNAELCEAIAAWLRRRYRLSEVDAGTQVLTANGTREALFAVAHALINPEATSRPYVLMPNPMYQIYLGAAVTAGGRPYFMPCTAATGFAPDLDAVPEDVWEDTALVYLCSPSNPTGWIADEAYLTRLIGLADRHDFFIVSDECYSEIYWKDAPVGLLEVCERMGRTDFRRCLVMNSLSKRSALPGLRSGLIAGDAGLIARFAKLRSYTGPATPLPLQHVAARAWADEAHVQDHLKVYRESLRAFFDVWGEGAPPAGSFFVWLPVGDGEAFAKAAFAQQAVTVLPGAYLGAGEDNPGAGFVRAALVDGPDKAAELAHRLRKVRI